MPAPIFRPDMVMDNAPVAQPIATAPRNGKVILLYTATGEGAGTIAKAFWHASRHHSGMWAYAMPDGYKLIHQVDYEPTHWAMEARAFLDENLTESQN